MYDIERRNKILEILHKKKSCSVRELAEQLMFSEATIRRDLNALDKEMKVRKTFGGAVIMEKYITEVPYNVRQSESIEKKAKIARAAVSLLTDNMTLFLPSSATVEHILPYLENYTGLTVITNCPVISAKLCKTDVDVYCTGGKLLHHSNSYVGEFARAMISKINADLMFFSVRGVSNDGKLTNSSTFDEILPAMMDNSKKVCLLFDSEKFEQTYRFTVCNINDVDTVITDKPLPKGLKRNNLIIAE